MSTDTYKGWTNYQTWAVKLWLDSDYETYVHVQGVAQQAIDYAPTCDQVAEGIWTVERAERFLLTDALEAYVSGLEPDIEASMFSDLLRHALGQVSFDEIARVILSDFDRAEGGAA